MRLKSGNSRVPQEGKVRIVNSSFTSVYWRERGSLGGLCSGPIWCGRFWSLWHFNSASSASQLCFADCFLPHFSLQFSRERSSVCQRKCQNITSICPVGCLDRTILITSKGEDAWDRKSETQLFIVQVVISGSVRTEEKQPADFCLMHLAFIFFITMYKDFLHKETYTVLINSVYGFNWNSSKSEIFVRLFMTRNKCKRFF